MGFTADLLAQIPGPWETAVKLLVKALGMVKKVSKEPVKILDDIHKKVTGRKGLKAEMTLYHKDVDYLEVVLMELLDVLDKVGMAFSFVCLLHQLRLIPSVLPAGLETLYKTIDSHLASVEDIANKMVNIQKFKEKIAPFYLLLKEVDEEIETVMHDIQPISNTLEHAIDHIPESVKHALQSVGHVMDWIVDHTIGFCTKTCLRTN